MGGPMEKRNFDMTQIGSFRRDENGVYTGTIRTLSVNQKVTIQPSAGEHIKAPDHRIFAGKLEFGAAWAKVSREDVAYLSVKLDDPSFPSPIYATLVEGDGGEHKLIWSR